MTILFLYQDVQSGSKNATESLLKEFIHKYPQVVCRVYKQPASKYKKGLPFLKNLLWSIYDYWRVINSSEEFDCVYSTMYTFAVAHYFSTRRNRPSIFHLHGDQKFSNPPRRQPLVKHIYRHTLGLFVMYLQRFAVMRSTLVYMASEKAGKKFLIENKLTKYHHKIKFVANGINRQQFFPILQTQKVKYKNKLGFSGKIILYIGRIDEKKGIHNLVDALGKDKDKTLLIVHPKCIDMYEIQYKDFLKKISKSSAGKVVFIENPDRVNVFYQISDLFVLPSVQEMMPLTVLEAMACGTMILVSKTGDLPKILKPLSKYVFMKRIDVRGISRGISKMSKLTTETQNLIVATGLKIVSNFSWGSSAEKLYNDINQITRP